MVLNHQKTSQISLILLTFLILCVSCGSKPADTPKNTVEPPVSEVISDNTLDYIEEVQEIDTIVPASLPAEFTYGEGAIHIKFNEFELEIDSLYVWNPEKDSNKVYEDTSIQYMDLGSTIQNRLVKIKFLREGQLEIYQRFENSITIMNEGPHCDLTEWQHYDSEWQPLVIKDDVFTTNEYSDEDWQRFGEVDINDLRAQVRKQCGDEWADHIDTLKSPHEYPSGIGTSRIFLKFKFTNAIDEIPVERIISFEIPMGC